MIIKKFQGKNEEIAVEIAKKELGDNVVIMNVKNVKQKGIFSFLKPQLTEITVALEEEVEKPKVIPTVFGQTATPFSILSQDMVAKTDTSSITYQRPNEASFESALMKSEKSSNALEQKLDSLQSLLEKQLTKPEEQPKQVKSSEDEKQDEMVVFMQLLYNTMIDNEVNEIYANQIIDEVEKINKSNMPIDYILANIYQRMILKFGNPEGIVASQKGPKVVVFIGPTGVGKTTTIAKIASKFCVNEKKKIALLTTDTYRIAAAEQLRTYASILDVPFRVIYTPEEMENALRDFKEEDYIFIDTAGHSHNNEAQRENMEQFLNRLGDEIEKEVFLVVSATTKYRDLTNIADTYAKMIQYKIIFTKLDETTTVGNLLNLKLHTGAELSYVTCGQNVPDDIENFNPQKTVKQLLGGKRP